MRYLNIFLIATLCALFISSCKAEEERPLKKEIQERVRPAAAGGTSAAYFSYSNTLENADTLISVNSSVARVTQVHKSFETEDGMMGMREQKEVIIPAGSKLNFQQGGLHIMLMDLNEDLNAGDSVLVEFELKLAGNRSILLPVRP